MEVQDIIRSVSSIVKKHLPADSYSVMLFGSQARGDAYSTSDVDIAIVGDSPVPFRTMTEILEEKDAIPTLRKIDIVDLRSADAPFRESILSYAKRI